MVVNNYNYFLNFNNISPDLVIRIGQKPVSKILCEKLNEWNDCTILIDECGRFNDDCNLVLIQDIESAVKLIKSKVNPVDPEWKDKVIELDSKIKNSIIKSHLDSWFEGTIAKSCFDSLSDGDSFFIGNSMPIRDVDMFVLTSEKKIYTYSNRGASGIDGIVSSALGVASKSGGRTLLLIGDLSFYHDMNGLLASRHGARLTIVVINNGGGGIFSFLPIAKIDKENFKEFWTTNTGLDLKNVATLYECQYVKVKNLPNLKENIQNSFTVDGIKIIEIQTKIDENVSLHEKFMEKVAKEISNY